MQITNKQVSCLGTTFVTERPALRNETSVYGFLNIIISEKYETAK